MLLVSLHVEVRPDMCERSLVDLLLLGIPGDRQPQVLQMHDRQPQVLQTHEGLVHGVDSVDCEQLLFEKLCEALRVGELWRRRGRSAALCQRIC